MMNRQLRWIAVFCLMLLGVGANAGVAFVESTLPNNPNVTPGLVPGSSLAVSGEWAAVGSYDSSNSASCYVTMYRFNYTTWAWQWFAELGGNRSCTANKGFGAAISLSGTQLAVGRTNYGSKNYGAVSTYQFDGTSWNSKADIIASTTSGSKDQQTDSGFGDTLSIRGNYLVIGAPKYDTTTNVDAGKIYIYDWNATSSGGVYPALAVSTGSSVSENYGAAVTGSGNQILVGAPGASGTAGAGYLYDFNGTTLAFESSFSGQSVNDFSGWQVAMDGNNTLLMGWNSYGFAQNADGSWPNTTPTKTFSGTALADGSISDGQYAAGYMGSHVELTHSLGSDSNYTVSVIPSTTFSALAEDISLDRDQLLVKTSNTTAPYAYDMPCGTGYDLQANQWAMIGIPCAIPAGTTVSQAFNTNGSSTTGDDLGTYDTNWVVYEQNTTSYGKTSASYIKLAAGDTVEQGRAYWIICDHNVTTRIDSSISSTRTTVATGLASGAIAAHALVPVVADANVTGDGNVTVMMSNSLSRSFDWSNVMVYTSLGFNNIATAGNILKNSTAYVYDPSQNGQPYRAVSTTPGLTNKIKSGEGFWIQVLAPNTNVDLLEPFEK